ncbi:hypothetical protein [Desulfosporosinus sp.]|nr:hypothetical protein [Desulfosporosinus sp.]
MSCYSTSGDQKLRGQLLSEHISEVHGKASADVEDFNIQRASET